MQALAYKPFLAFLSLQKAATLLGLWPLPPFLKLAMAGQIFLKLQHSDMPLLQSKLPLPSSNKDVCDYIGPTWIIQGKFPISRSLISHILKVLSTMYSNIHGFWGFAIGITVGPLFSLLQLAKNPGQFE